MEQTTSSSGQWTQTTEQSARQLRNWSATATSQWWSPYNWRSEAANCASPVHSRQSFAAFYTAANQQPTCGYSTWLSMAFTCTTMFLGAWPDISYTRAYRGSVPGTTQPSACGDALWASRQTKSKILWHLAWCWHTNTHASTVTHRLRTLCMHELTPSRFPVPPSSTQLVFT